MSGSAADLRALAHLADEHLDGLDASILRGEGDGIGEGIVWCKKCVARIEQMRRKTGRRLLTVPGVQASVARSTRM